MYETVLFGDPATMLRGQIEGPYLTYHSKQISDQNGGNNDSFCNPGESIEMFLTIQNVGSLPSETVPQVWFAQCQLQSVCIQLWLQSPAV